MASGDSWFAILNIASNCPKIKSRITIHESRMTNMEQRQLGGLRVSSIGLGCMGMSAAYGVPDDAESTRTIQRAIDLGVTFIDTADVYGGGRNEELVGRALRGRRDS